MLRSILTKQTIGKLGEQLAKFYCLLKFYCILQANYRTNFGEIDLIALDGKTLVFIEVKTAWKENQNFPLIFKVNKKKKGRILQVAEYYIKNNRKDYLRYSPKRIRFDVIILNIRNILLKFNQSIIHKKALF